MSLRNTIFKSYLRITNSIAFYPAFIATGFFIFSLLVMYVEYHNYLEGIKEKMSLVLVKSIEDARLILGTLVASIISLMVFSFSMVMVVLNSASSTFSPRVIPGLITNKSHQFVLGIYLGTIIYCLLLIINVHDFQTENQIPKIGVLFAMLFGVFSLALFVYFIHTISKNILVDDILDSIFNRTLRIMKAQPNHVDDISIPDTSNWKILQIQKTGYQKKIKKNSLLEICIHNDLQVQILQDIGFFMVKDYPYLKVSRADVSENVEKALQECFIFYPEERLEDHYLFGFKQISEIAAKALSPGINDPGTAIKAIDMLSILLIQRMEMPSKRALQDKDGKVRVVLSEPSLEKLLFDNITIIREYGKNDVTVMLQLLESLKNMLYADREGHLHLKTLLKYINSMINSCQNHMKNELDVSQINKMIDVINRNVPKENRVDYIKPFPD